MGAMVSSEEEGEVGETLQSGDTQHGDSNLEKVGSGNLEVGSDEVLPSDSPDSTTYQDDDEESTREENLSMNPIKEIKQRQEINHIPDKGRREDGDGMEKPSLVKTPSEIFKGVVLPETGVALEKIPPIADKVDLLPVIPKSSLIKQKAKVYPKGTYPPAVKKAKEARFIPCEPYKGAVSPLSNRHQKSSPSKAMGRLSLSRSSPEKSLSAPNLGLKLTPSQRKQPILPVASLQQDTEERVKDDCEEKLEPIDVGGGLEMNPLLEANYRTMLDAKERELERLRVALTDAEKQLRIQGQVNGELKSLLVASVGEDIEARLDFLTQDKARLAADVLHYNKKISRDWEEKEALHVESDIWRSKFLASTVILEEFNRSKQILETRNHQLEHTARRMIIERKDFATKLNVADNMLKSLLPSPAPTAAGGSPAASAGASPDTVASGEIIVDEHKDLSGLCMSIEANTKKICDKFAGDRVARYTPATEPMYKPTLPEKEMEQLLAEAEHHSGESDLPGEASCRLTRGARTMLLKMGDEALSPGKSAFNSCSHCNGTVETV